MKGTVVLDSFCKDSRPQFPSCVQTRMKNGIKWYSSFEEEPLSTCNCQCFDILDKLFHEECWVMLTDTINCEYAPTEASLCGSEETKCGNSIL